VRGYFPLLGDWTQIKIYTATPLLTVIAFRERLMFKKHAKLPCIRKYIEAIELIMAAKDAFLLY